VVVAAAVAAAVADRDATIDTDPQRAQEQARATHGRSRFRFASVLVATDASPWFSLPRYFRFGLRGSRIRFLQKIPG
jgi:hypothetical protein